MVVARYCKWVGLAVALGWGATAVAQTQATLNAEKNRLARMEQSLENRMVEAEDFENELLAYDYKLGEARDSLEEARENYEQSRIELTRAEREHKRNADTNSERQLRKAKHAFKMAQRGVDSRSRRVEIIQSNYEELKAEEQSVQQAIARSRDRIAAQKSKVDGLVAAMLQKAESARRAEKLAKSQPPVKKPELPEPSMAKAAEAQDTGSSAAAQGEALDEIDEELLAYVKREQARLKELMAEKGEGQGTHTFKSLTLESSRGDPHDFEFLGHNQYRVVAPVEAGLQTYEVSGFSTLKFRRTIPAEDAGKNYVFILDARRLSRPRLIMYPEYALSYLD
ncbi:MULTISPECIES: hypothetical protein [Microbulbifer]|uniref:hypothetical protein n=1 Tax=Microbulbifer TaxID=48073 RepID=UPI001E3EA585|nr:MULTISPECIES: hypothetical protein [Microbulbifer]UHQ55959.1 hypothetical protein LVE68_02945 [Microbulbifer sp. YPW16]